MSMKFISMEKNPIFYSLHFKLGDMFPFRETYIVKYFSIYKSIVVTFEIDLSFFSTFKNNPRLSIP